MVDRSANGRRPSAGVLTLQHRLGLGGRGLVLAAESLRSSIAQAVTALRGQRGVMLADKLAGGWRQATHGAGRAVGELLIMLLCSSSTVWL